MALTSLRLNLVALLDHCHVDGDNPEDCILNKIRIKLSYADRKIWVEKLSEEEVERFIKMHTTCHSEKIRELNSLSDKLFENDA